MELKFVGPNPANRRYYRRYTERHYIPYALAIGQLALAWNDLHEKFGLLFCALIDASLVSALPAAWSSLPSDRAKRGMLKATAEATVFKTGLGIPDYKRDIIWVINQAESLEDRRNNAIHSPLIMNWWGALGKAAGHQDGVAPDNVLGNARAKKLAGTNLLREFRLNRDTILVLRDYVARIAHSISVEQAPWPDKPKLPNRGDKKSQHPRKRQDHRKSQNPPPQSSPP